MAWLTPTRLQSLRGRRVHGLAGARPSRMHQVKLEGGAPRRLDFVIVATPFVTLVTLVTLLTFLTLQRFFGLPKPWRRTQRQRF